MAFPTAYGKLQLSGFEKSRASSVLRTEMDDGFVKESKARSRVLISYPVTYRYSQAELALFEAWFLLEANGGAFFDWLDPLDGVLKQVRIMGSTYTIKPAEQGMGVELAVDVSFTLEGWSL